MGAAAQAGLGLASAPEDGSPPDLHRSQVDTDEDADPRSQVAHQVCLGLDIRPGLYHALCLDQRSAGALRPAVNVPLRACMLARASTRQQVRRSPLSAAEKCARARRSEP